MEPRRREDILEAALGAFEAKGVLGAGIADIRAASGASIGSIYHHFGDKEGIAAALHAHVLAEYQEGFVVALDTTDAQTGVKAVVAHHLRWAERRPARMRYLLGGPPGGEEVRTLNREFFGIVRAWWDGRARDLRDMDLTEAHAVWLGPATEYCRHWLAGNAPKPGPRRRDLFSETAWRSLCRP